MSEQNPYFPHLFSPIKVGSKRSKTALRRLPPYLHLNTISKQTLRILSTNAQTRLLYA